MKSACSRKRGGGERKKREREREREGERGSWRKRERADQPTCRVLVLGLL